MIYLFLNSSTGETAKSGGGVHATSHFHYMAKTLKQGGQLVCPDSENPDIKYEYLKDIEKKFFPDVSLVSKPIMARLIARAFKARKRLDFSEATERDVFLGSSYFLPDLLPMVYHSKKHNLKTVCYVFHLTRGQRKLNSLKNILVAWHEAICLKLLKNIDLLIVINEHTREQLVDSGFDTKKIFTTQCPLNTSFAGDMLPLDKKPYDLVFCGRFVQQKGVKDFLKVFEQVKQQKPNIKGVMVGAGPLLDEVRSYIEEHRLDIETPGFVTEEEKFDYFRQSKLFVFPSYEEGWGIVLNESMLVGTPTLAYKLPIYQSIFGNNVEVVARGNIDALAQQTSAYLQRIQDDETWYLNQQVAQKEFALQFSLEKTAGGEWERIKALFSSKT